MRPLLHPMAIITFKIAQNGLDDPKKWSISTKKLLLALLGFWGLKCCPFKPIVGNKAPHVSIITPNSHYHFEITQNVLMDPYKWYKSAKKKHFFAILGSPDLIC